MSNGAPLDLWYAINQRTANIPNAFIGGHQRSWAWCRPARQATARRHRKASKFFFSRRAPAAHASDVRPVCTWAAALPGSLLSYFLPGEASTRRRNGLQAEENSSWWPSQCAPVRSGRLARWVLVLLNFSSCSGPGAARRDENGIAAARAQSWLGKDPAASFLDGRRWKQHLQADQPGRSKFPENVFAVLQAKLIQVPL